MASFNKVLLMGNLVRDPELRVTPSGLAVCRFTLATSRVIKQTDGNNKEETTFVDVEAFGKSGEVVAKYFQKGRPIFVEGRLRLNEWQTNNGEKRSKLLVVLENFVFTGGNKPPSGNIKTEGKEGEKSSTLHYEKVSPANEMPEESTQAAYGNDNDSEDVPF